MAQSQGSLPAVPSPTPGLPESADFIEFAGFDGIDTKPPRPGVADNNCSWLDNLMPLGKNNIRAIPDLATPIYATPDGLSIVHFDFFGLQPNGVNTGPHSIIVLSDGSAVDLNITAVTQGPIAPAGTFLPPANTFVTVRQYGIQYLLIATVQSQNAYWIYDGSVLYGAGTLGPEAVITDGGTGYTSAPGVLAFGGSGTGSAVVATVENGSVSTVTVTAPGSGYLSSDATTAVLLFTGGGGGTSAVGVGAIVDGAITSIQIISGGSGFTSVPGITITGSGTGAAATVTAISNGTITTIVMVDCGSGYTAGTVIGTTGGGGSGLNAAAVIQNGVINGVSMSNVGSGYLEAPQVNFISPTGSGATGTAILSGDTVVGVDFGFGSGSGFTGEGYSGSVIVAFQGGGGPASGTIQLMPFGINGNSIEVYQSQVWIATTLLGVKIFFSAPESVVDFGPPNGGGAFPATQSNLRYQWTRLIQSNGFLYLLGDSAVNYISGVTSSGSPVVTTFSNLNVDPQIGSPFRDSCIEYSRAIMMVNSFGVHAIYGGAVQKVSTQLDGIFNSENITFNVIGGPSSAIATLFGVHCYVLLLPIIDPITNGERNALFMWDGKRWWSASQSVAFTKIMTLEWGSDISAWGTDNHFLYQLFQVPSTNTTKTLQSKLYTKPGIPIEKKGWMLYALWKSTQASTLEFTIDTENGSTAVTQGPFVGNVGAAATWARSKIPDTLGFAMGFTMTSVGADFTLIDATIIDQQRRLKT